MGNFKYIDDTDCAIEILDSYTDDLQSLSNGYNFRVDLARKLCEYGKIVVLTEKNIEVGFAAFYCNDLLSKIGFLSLIAIKKENRGQGYASKLLKFVIEEMKCAGMMYLKLEVRRDNCRAITFYEKERFVIESSNKTSFYMIKSLN